MVSHFVELYSCCGFFFFFFKVKVLLQADFFFFLVCYEVQLIEKVCLKPCISYANKKRYLSFDYITKSFDLAQNSTNVFLKLVDH